MTTTTTTTSSATSYQYYLLTGDVGGTNSRMSLCLATDPDHPIATKYYRNAEYLPEHTHNDPKAFATYIITPFLKYCWTTVRDPRLVASLDSCRIFACLALAGTVSNNRVSMTNLGNLLVDGNIIAAADDNPYIRAVVECRIINDFVAQGYGCLSLLPHEVQYLSGPFRTLEELYQSEQNATAPKVCVGAGTGLGECFLTPLGESGAYACFPSEGGHVEYAPRNELQVRLHHHLLETLQITRVSVERVVSGNGLVNVYEFLTKEFPDRIDPVVQQEFEQTAPDERARVVAHAAHRHANEEPDEAKKERSLPLLAMQILMQAYGSEVGSAAIKWLPISGLFVTGGLTPKNLQFMVGDTSDFITAYRDKGRVSPILDRVPLFAVLVEDLGVRGVLHVALQEYQEWSAASSSQLKQGASATYSNKVTQILSFAAPAVLGVALGLLVRPKK